MQTLSQTRKTNYPRILAISLLIVGLVSAFAHVNSPAVNAYALSLANKAGLTKKTLCFFIPDRPSAFNTIDENTLKDWNRTFRYTVNPQNLSVVETDLGSALRQRFVPSDQGSERVIATIRAEARTTYELRQSIFFEEGFDWGASSESGKFGFGLGGGSAPTGGKTDKDGFTVRLAWHGLGDGSAYANLYIYSADRNQNLPYGDLIKIPNFIIPIGEWFDVAMRVTVNSELNIADGSVSVWINDQLLLERKNIHWQTEGEKPSIDSLTYSTFHGGNTTSWSPDQTVFAQFSNICLYD